MKKLYALFIILLIGLMISKQLNAQQKNYFNPLNIKGDLIKQDHLDSMLFRNNLRDTHFNPRVYPINNLVLPKQKAELINLTAGTLSTILTETQKATITNLQLTGTIDARDFKTMRDSMPDLSDVDLSAISISAYTGTQGTEGPTDTTYQANTVPQKAFADTQLLSIIFPGSITSIADSAFVACFSLDNITIPNSVTSIGEHAFDHCFSLTSMIIPNSVTKISDDLFFWSGLTDITIPSSVTSIGVEAFSRCPMTKIIIPNSVTTIGESAFCVCPFLTSITIPNAVTAIKYQTFARCGRLTSISIPNSVTSIGDDAFAMSGLTSVTLPNSLTTIGGGSFIFCKLNNLEIPNSVTSIGNGAFEAGLSGTLIIPNSVVTIDSSAFEACGLTSIYSYSNEPIDLSYSPNVFDDVDKSNCTLYVPAGSKTLYQKANQWKDFLNIIEMAPTGLDKLTDKEHFILYPNPFTEGFYIDAVDKPATISVYNLMGEQLMSKQITTKSYVDIAGLPQGQYIVKIITADGIVEKKLIKK